MKDAKGHGSNPRGTLSKLGIPLGTDFHTLNSSKVQDLVDEAKRQGYRKPANANGSTGRYFHDRLQRQAAKDGPSNGDAGGALSGGGAKSAPAPTHDSMSIRNHPSYIDMNTSEGRAKMVAARARDAASTRDEADRDLRLLARNGQVGSGMKFRG